MQALIRIRRVRCDAALADPCYAAWLPSASAAKCDMGALP